MQSLTRVLRNHNVDGEEAVIDGTTPLVPVTVLRDRQSQLMGDEVLVGGNVVVDFDGDGPTPNASRSEKKPAGDITAEGAMPEPHVDPVEVARSEAELLIDEATKHAMAIVADAEARRDAVLLEARTEGYEDGYQAGIAQGEAVVKRGAGVVEEMARRLVREEARMAHALEGRLAQLAVDIARKILRKELSSSTADVAELVAASLHHFTEDEKLIVRLNPVDAAQLKASGGEHANMFEASGPVKVVEDRRVSRGGCIVESPSGQLDARPEVQLERVAEVFEVETSHGAGVGAVDSDSDFSHAAEAASAGDDNG